MATKTTCPSPLMHTKFESQEWLKYFAITYSTWPNSLFRSALFNSEINAWWPNALRIACFVQWPDILGFPNAYSNFQIESEILYPWTLYVSTALAWGVLDIVTFDFNNSFRSLLMLSSTNSIASSVLANQNHASFHLKWQTKHIAFKNCVLKLQ